MFDALLGVTLCHLGGHLGLHEDRLKPSWTDLDPRTPRAPLPDPKEVAGGVVKMRMGASQAVSPTCPPTTHATPEIAEIATRWRSLWNQYRLQVYVAREVRHVCQVRRAHH
eukprot:8248883-Pyramimonas_sp.AAC.1